VAWYTEYVVEWYERDDGTRKQKRESGFRSVDDAKYWAGITLGAKRFIIIKSESPRPIDYKH
jgi:hypothetical protein